MYMPAQGSDSEVVLVQAGLLHNAHELLLVDLTIAVTISFVNHFLQLLVGHVLTELLGDTLKVLERDLAGLIVIEQPEGLEDLLLRVLLTHLSRHHLKELVEVNSARTILVDQVERFTDLLTLLLGKFSL